MLSDQSCQFLDPFTDEPWQYPVIPRSFYRAEAAHGGPEIFAECVAEFQEKLATLWAETRGDSSPEESIRHLNLSSPEPELSVSKNKETAEISKEEIDSPSVMQTVDLNKASPGSLEDSKKMVAEMQWQV
jgi:hypothetical protein